MRRTLLIPALLLLGACKVGPDYTRPEAVTKAPEAFRGQAKAEDTSLADLAWWEVFKDPTLQSLVDEALRNGGDLRLATARLEEAQARAGYTKADAYPWLSYGAEANRGKAWTPFGTLATGNQFGASLSASWELDLWGRLRRANEGARAQVLASAAGRRGVQLSLASAVASEYLALRGLDLQLDIARRTVSTQQRTLDLFQSRLSGGVSNKMEYSRALANLGYAQSSVPDLERQIAAKENQLCLLLGRFPGPIARGAALVDTPAPPQVPAGLPANLLERRPDLVAAEQQLVAANAAIGVAKANYFPRLSLTGLLGLSNGEASDLFNADKSGIWGAAAGIAGPLFQGGRVRAGKAIAEAQAQQAQVAYEQAVRSAFRDAADALTAQDKLRQMVTAQEQVVGALKDSTDLSRTRYTGGLGSYLDVLDAERQLFAAELSLAQARTALLQTYIQLNKALGGGWKQGDDWTRPAK